MKLRFDIEWLVRYSKTKHFEAVEKSLKWSIFVITPCKRCKQYMDSTRLTAMKELQCCHLQFCSHLGL